MLSKFAYADGVKILNKHLCSFSGRVVAKAIYDNKLLDAYFTRSFYKHILGIPVKVSDMEAEDYSFYQGLVYLLEHDIDEIGVELTFSTDVSVYSLCISWLNQP